MKRTLVLPSRVLVWALLAGAPLACTPYASEDDGGTASSSSSGSVTLDSGNSTPPDASVPDASVTSDAGIPDAGPQGARAIARQYFVDNVWPVFQAQGCVTCHSGATSMQPFLSSVTTPSALDAYPAVLAAHATHAPFISLQLVNLTQPPLSVILNKGAHQVMAGPPFGRNALDLQHFLTWCGLERDAAIFEGTYTPVWYDAGVPDAAQPVDAAVPPDAAMTDDAGISTVNPLPDAGPSNTPTTDPYGGMVHHNLTPPLSPQDVVDLLNQEGPPEYSTRIHGCSKLSYVALGNVLTSRGMTLGGSAGSIYQSKPDALGAANFVKGVPEARQLSTAGAAKFLDLVLEAASEVVAGVPTASACADPEGLGGSVGGQARIFNDTACGAGLSGCCLESGVSCILGIPATVDHLAMCDAVVSSTLNNNGQSLDPTLGKVVAVGTLLAASFVCE